jgi:hypothetical protein
MTYIFLTMKLIGIALVLVQTHFNLTFTAVANAVVDWKVKKEASLHGGAEDQGQPQEEEEEENIYAVAPEPDVRECYMPGIFHAEYCKIKPLRSGLCHVLTVQVTRS